MAAVALCLHVGSILIGILYVNHLLYALHGYVLWPAVGALNGVGKEWESHPDKATVGNLLSLPPAGRRPRTAEPLALFPFPSFVTLLSGPCAADRARVCCRRRCRRSCICTVHKAANRTGRTLSFFGASCPRISPARVPTLPFALLPALPPPPPAELRPPPGLSRSHRPSPHQLWQQQARSPLPSLPPQSPQPTLRRSPGKVIGCMLRPVPSSKFLPSPR